MNVPAHIELRRQLGAGGMGVVYEAYDRERGELVAVKRVTRLAPDARLRFRREFGAMHRLRHANIVRVHEYWEDDDGLPAYSMELIRGGDLTGLLQRWKASRHAEESWRGAVEAILKLLRPLETLHRAGFVHRDLKPANVLLNEEGVVKLTDFGLVVPTGEAGTRGKLLGTPAYIAPEQILGRDADRRADLYSVGVMLFEFLVGRRPFHAKDLRTLLKDHIASAPPIPSAEDSRIPTALDGIVSRALAKEPEARFASADDFARALVASLGSMESGGDEAPSDAGSHPGPESSAWRLFRPGLAGRDKELRSLLGEGPSEDRVTLLQGEIGLGKSRLLEEAASRLLSAGVRAIRADCSLAGSDAYAATRPIVRDLLGWLGRGDALGERASDAILLSGGAEPTEDIASSDAVESGMQTVTTDEPLALDVEIGREAVEPRESRDEGVSHGAAPLEGELVALARLLDSDANDTDEEERSRDPLPELAAAVWHLMQRVSSQGPVVLLLDDLERADHRSQDLWIQIAERLSAEANHGGRIRLVVTLDSDEASGQALAERLVKAGAVEGRRLAPLDRESMLQVLRSMLSTDLVPERLGELIERSGAGHPGFAIAYVRWLAERGFLRFTQEQWRFEAPSGAEGSTAVGAQLFSTAVSSALEGMEAKPKRLLGFCAVVGSRVPFWLLEQLWGAGEEGALEAVNALIHAGLLRELPDDEFALFHPSVREVIETRIREVWGEQDLWDVLDTAYLCLERRAARLRANEEQILFEVAYRTGRLDSAARSALKLGLHNARLHASRQARSEFERARDCARESPGAGLVALRAEVELGTLLRRLGELRPAREAMERAKRLSEEHPTRPWRVRILEELGLISAGDGRLEDAERFYADAMEEARGAGEIDRLASIEANLGELRFAQGRLEEALHSFRNALAEMTGQKDQSDRAYILNNVGVAAERIGRHEEAMEAHVSALEAFRHAGDRYGEAMSLGNHGTALHRLGRHAEALECLRESSVLRDWLGDRAGAAIALQNIGFVELARERYRAGVEALERALERGRELENLQMEAGCLSNLSAAFLALGRLPRAEEAASESLLLFQRAKSEPGAEVSRRRHASVQLARGAYRAAVRAFRRGARRSVELGDAVGAAQSWLGLGRGLLGLGRVAHARDALRRARMEYLWLGQPAPAGEACEALAEVSLRTARYEEALRWLREARRLSVKGASRAVGARTLVLYGELLASRSKLDAARRSARSGLRQLRILERGVDSYNALEALGRISLARGDHDEALRMFEQVRTRGATLGSTVLELRGELGVALALGRSGFAGMAIESLDRCWSQLGRSEDAWLRDHAVEVRAELQEMEATTPAAPRDAEG